MVGPAEPLPFPSPTGPRDSRAEVFLGYLDYFRATVVGKVTGLDEEALRSSRLPSGWTPLELLNHLVHMERRWLVWGFLGQPVPDPWGDSDGEGWVLPPEATLAGLTRDLDEQAAATRAVLADHALDEIGRPGERWDGQPPPTLERVLFHVLQEYARHAGHLDIVRELADGTTGE